MSETSEVTKQATLTDRVAKALAEQGPMSAHDVADYLGVSVRSALNALSFARGRGTVNDGTVLYDHTPGIALCAHRPEPVIWSAGPSSRVAAGCPARDAQ